MSGKRRADGPASTKRPGPKKQKRTGKQRLKRFAAVAGIGFLVLTLLGAAAFVVLYQAIEIPDPNEDFQTETTFVYYAGGDRELGQFAEQNRDSIPLREMPQTMQDAVVAAENQSFWTDRGIDPKGIVRAAFNNAQGGAVQGASTITQQYVKILYLTQDRALERKVKEAFLSLKIQRQQSKRQILEGYLNTIYFGRGAYGIQAAAEAFFDVDAADLDLRQSAVLASVLNNPTALDPANGRDARERLVGRYQYVLQQMAETGAITEQESERAQQRLPKFPRIEAESQYGGQRGHVLTMVRDELLRLGFTEEEVNGGGLQVTTTFTPQAMDAAREGVEAQRPEGFGTKELHVGVASVEPGTGAVRGIFGGQDFLDSQINWAVAGGQAGSTFKPFALAAAIEQGFSLRDTFEGNSPLVLPDGTDVENQGDTDYGRVDMLGATENSVNTAFIDMTLGMEEGPESIIETAVEMGIPPAEPRSARAPGFPNRTPGLEPVLGVALGSQTVSPINMANGYATIAAGGVAAEPYIIERVVDESGETRYQHRDETERAIPEDIAADVSYAMEQVVQSGSGTAALALGRPAAGKTGTATKTGGAVSSSWFAGFTPQLSTAVVYTRGDGTGQLDGWLPEYFGGSYPARTWTDVMTRALEGEEVLELAEPAFVDGEAPSDGYEPVPTEAPEPTTAPEPQQPQPQQPQPQPQPTRTPEPQPTPTPTPTEPPEPEDPCILDPSQPGCPGAPEEPEGSPTPPPSSPSTPPGQGRGGSQTPPPGQD